MKFLNGKDKEDGFQERPVSSGNSFTIIGKGTVIKGDVHATEDLRIDGTVEGSIKCEGKILLGQDSKVQAAIQSHELRIDGEYKGDLKLSKQLTIGSKGVVSGNIEVPSIVVDEGAILVGDVKMPKSNKEVFSK